MELSVQAEAVDKKVAQTGNQEQGQNRNGGNLDPETEDQLLESLKDPVHTLTGSRISLAYTRVKGVLPE